MAAELRFRDGIRGANKEGYFSQLHDGDAAPHRDSEGFWIVTAFDDVREALLDHRRFSSASMGAGFPLLSDDPPRHSVLRALLSRAFTPAAIEALRPQIETLAADMTAQIPRGSEIDVVDALTSPLPVTVIARMMGVPESDADRFRSWSNAIIGLQDGPLDGARVKTLADLRTYFLAIAQARRAAPREDLISALACADEAGVTLSDEQIVGFAILLMIAGNETTTNLLGNLLDRLARDRDAWARLKGDPAAQEAAIEEALRMDSPAQFVMRTAREDTLLGGQQITKGEMLIVYLAAANRDPAKWRDPALFDLARARERHLAFGHGVHTCIGAPLARLEAQCAMRALVDRFDAVAPGARPGVRVPSGLLYGFRALPLVFS